MGIPKIHSKTRTESKIHEMDNRSKNINEMVSKMQGMSVKIFEMVVVFKDCLCSGVNKVYGYGIRSRN